MRQLAEICILEILQELLSKFSKNNLCTLMSPAQMSSGHRVVMATNVIGILPAFSRLISTHQMSCVLIFVNPILKFICCSFTT